VTTSPDGPLKVLLRRFPDREPRFWLQRWKPDHPVTISLTLEELDVLEAAIGIAREQAAIEARSESSGGSSLDLGVMVDLKLGRAA
jgi:hypothetical protein